MKRKPRKQNSGVPLCRDCAWYYQHFMGVFVRLDERTRLCRCQSCGKIGLRMSYELKKQKST